MNSERFLELVDKARARQDNLLKAKGAEYTRHSEDRLANFKRAGEALGLPPIVIWGVYAGKHWDSIMTFLRFGQAESVEAIEGRFDDLHNYLYLAEALIEEDRERAEILAL